MIIGSDLLFLRNLPSTNSYAADLLRKNNPPEGTIVYTNFQSAGKGNAGNKWNSEDDKNLLISIILYPSFIKPEDQFCISMMLSLGISDFLMRFIPACSVKWPNDIYVNNDKIAGILIESAIIGQQIENTIAGIGLNINQQEFPETIPNPVSLLQLSGRAFDLPECLKLLAADLDRRYKQLISGECMEIRKEYILKLYRLNEWFEYRDERGIFSGKILSIGDFGRIRIERLNGSISEYAFKEIEFIP